MYALYLAGSFAGIVLIVVLNTVLFGPAQPNVGSATAIAERLAQEIPGFRAGEIAVGADGRSALVEDTRDGKLYLLAAQGDGIVSRKLGRELLGQTHRDGAALTLHLHDFTLPSVRISLGDEHAARRWAERLEA